MAAVARTGKHWASVTVLLILLLALPLAVLPGRAPAQDTNKPVKWVFDPQSTFNDSKITTSDIDANGREEVLVGNMNGWLYCLTSTGQLKWAFYCGSPIRGGAACYDVNGDTAKEIFFGAMNGYVYGLDCNGLELSQWGWPKPTAVVSGFTGVYGVPAIGDVNGDGVADIVAGTWGQHIYAWSYTGGLLPGWPFDNQDSIWSSPALADLDRDGRKEVIIGADCTGGPNWPYPPGGLLWVLRGDGSVYPGFPQCTPEVLWSSPACADIDNDGYYEIIIGTGHYYTAVGYLTDEAFRVYAFNHDGSMCAGWPVRTSGCTMGAPAVGDVDGDGMPEIAIGCYRAHLNLGADCVYLIKGNGAVMWERFGFGGPFRGSPALGDINSDGSPEVIVGSENTIGAWDIWGNCVWRQSLGITMFSSPAVGDFDRDGRVETAVATGADNGGGALFVLDCGPKQNVSGGDRALFPWPMFHRTDDHAGAMPPSPPVNFHEYLTVMNPNDQKANVTVEFMDENGNETDVPWTVDPNSRSTMSVNKYVKGIGISAKVTSDVPIICERPMYFNYKGAWTGGHDVMGALAPAPTFYFAEGSCRPGIDSYLCIQNPGDADAEVRITYMKGDRTTYVQPTFTVEPKSRRTIAVLEALYNGQVANDVAHDFSAKVECTNGQNIVCERPMYFNYRGWTGGHNVMGIPAPSAAYNFAEGSCRPSVDSYLCIQNPGDADAAVQITYRKGDRTTYVQPTFTVKAKSRKTIAVLEALYNGQVANDVAHDFSAEVKCTNGQSIICERPMYFDYQGWTGGHNVMGAGASATEWYFAEGYTGE